MKPEDFTTPPDWFARAVDEVVNDRTVQAHSKARQDAILRAKTGIADSARAVAEFNAAEVAGAPIIRPNDPPPWATTASGGIGGVSPGRTSGGARYGNITRPPAAPRPPTPEEGLNAIRRHIEDAPDAAVAFKLAGEWITKVTNAITEAVKDWEDEF